jgi:hypothetical protein
MCLRFITMQSIIRIIGTVYRQDESPRQDQNLQPLSYEDVMATASLRFSVTLTNQRSEVRNTATTPTNNNNTLQVTRTIRTVNIKIAVFWVLTTCAPEKLTDVSKESTASVGRRICQASNNQAKTSKAIHVTGRGVETSRLPHFPDISLTDYGEGLAHRQAGSPLPPGPR